MKKQTWEIAAFVILGISPTASLHVVRSMETKARRYAGECLNGRRSGWMIEKTLTS